MTIRYFLLCSLFLLFSQCGGLSVRRRTGNLIRRLRFHNKSVKEDVSPLPPPTPPPPSSSVPYGYNQVFGKPSQSYVPDGMDATEYQRLRQAEAAEAARKNYGAWGPRFRQDQRPDGDWLLLPQLWTSGVPDNANTSSNSGYTPNSTSRWYPLRRWLPAVVLAWILVDVMLTAVQLSFVASQLTVRQALWKALKLIIRGKQYLWQTYWKIMAAKITATAALTVPTQRLLDKWAQQTQYSRLRMITMSTLGSLVGLAGYALLLVGIRRRF